MLNVKYFFKFIKFAAHKNLYNLKSNKKKGFINITNALLSNI